MADITENKGKKSVFQECALAFLKIIKAIKDVLPKRNDIMKLLGVKPLK